MTAPDHERHTCPRELQQQAAAVLARLLDVDLPPVGWRVDSGEVPDYGTRPFSRKPTAFPLLEAQAMSHATVRAWAAHLGVEVGLDRGTTPSARAVVDGVGVRVWCAPRYRDRRGGA